MSAISRATLRQTIRDRGDYTNTKRFTTAYLNTEIQTAFAKFYQIVADAHAGWWDTFASITTVTNQAYLALPTDCWRVQGIDRLDSGTDYSEIRQINMSERNKFSGTGEVIAYRTSSRGLELFPTPDKAYTLRVLYTPKAPDLDESTTHEWYNGWEDYVIEATLLAIDKREQRPLGDRLQAVQMAEAYLKASAGERRQQEPEYLNLREYDGFDPFKDGLL